MGFLGFYLSRASWKVEFVVSLKIKEIKLKRIKTERQDNLHSGTKINIMFMWKGNISRVYCGAIQRPSSLCSKDLRNTHTKPYRKYSVAHQKYASHNTHYSWLMSQHISHATIDWCHSKCFTSHRTMMSHYLMGILHIPVVFNPASYIKKKISACPRNLFIQVF